MRLLRVNANNNEAITSSTERMPNDIATAAQDRKHPMQRLCWHKIDMAIWCGWSILSFHHKPPRDGRPFAVRHAKQIEAGGQAFQVDFVCVLVYFHDIYQLPSGIPSPKMPTLTLAEGTKIGRAHV